MPMTTIQRAALRNAQLGDWALANAIELLHRFEQASDDGKAVTGIIDPGSGRMRFLIVRECQSLAEGEYFFAVDEDFCSDCDCESVVTDLNGVVQKDVDQLDAGDWLMPVNAGEVVRSFFAAEDGAECRLVNHQLVERIMGATAC